MKKIYLLAILVLMVIVPGYGQYNINENKVWVFGNQSGLDFNGGGIPVPLMTNVTGHAGTASVCSSSGALLFYTDGEKVYDKTGALMPTGSSLVSYSTINNVQAAQIVPVIGNPNKYYIFSLEEGGTAGRLSYSIVDMTLNSGLGDVILASKGTSMGSGFSNKMTAVAGNNCNIWLIAHNVTTPEFYVYEITASGIGPMVTLPIGTLSNYRNGTIEVSPDRTKLVTSAFFGLELYDFNATTGVISNCQVLSLNYHMGEEFSPDNTKLYVKQSAGVTGVYQFDLSAGTTPAIIASETLIQATGLVTDLRLGVDNKIYFCNSISTGAIDCITAPNVAGAGCNYVPNYITLPAGTSNYGGLGTMYIRDPSMPYAGAITGASVVCTGSTIALTNATSGGTWSSSNTNVSVSPTGIVTGSTVGTSIVSYTVTTSCGSASATTTITVQSITSAGIITGPSAVCLGSTIALTDATPGGVWSSSNTNVTISSTGVVTGMNVGTSGISYTVTGACNTAVAKGTVTVVDMPGAVNGPTVVCTGATIVLTDAVGGGFWSSASSTIATASPTSGIVFGVTAGTATISYTIGGVCAATSVITVDPPLPAIKGPGKVCVGAMITLSDSVTAGTWSEPSGFVSVNPSTGDVYGMTAGTGIITYSVSSGCMALRAFTVNPNPSPIVLTSAVMCYSDMGMYATDADAGGTWTSALVTVSTGGYLTAYAIGSGLITYTLPTGCLTTTPITVNPLPALITGPKNICTGELTALADATFGGTWSTTEATILIDIYSGGLYGVSAGTAVVTYQLPTTCYVTDTITVSQSPTAILGSPNVCIGNLTTLSDAVPGGTWSISAGGLASISPLGTVLGIMAGAAKVTYTTGSGCTATVPVTIWPLPSLFTVTGGGSYCTGGTGVTVSLTGSVPGTKYYLFNGSTLIDSLMGTGSFLTYGLRTLPGFYTVYAVNTTTQCGNLMSGSALITIDPILTPAVSITTVPGDTVCLGGSITFVAGAANGGTAPGYQWKVNGVPAGTGGISFTYVPTDGDLIGIELTSNATCVDPITAYAFRTVGVVTPVVPVITLTADPGLSVAEGTTVTYTATVTNKVTAASYQWLKNGTAVSGANSPVFVDNDVRNFDTVSCRVWSGGFCSQSAIERLHMNVYKNDSGNNNTAVHNVTGADASIRVIPNPSRGVFTVTGTMTEEAVTLELTDMIGRMIYKGEVTAKDGKLNAEVQLSSIANGTYLLNVRSGAMHKVFHIIIEQ